MAAVVILGRVALFAAGATLVARILISAVQTFVLPRGVSDSWARAVFLLVRSAFELRNRRLDTYRARDSWMALFGPLALLTLLLSWLSSVLAGYVLMYWALGETPVHAIEVSGSSLFTLGFAAGSSLLETFMTFSEAGIGVLLAALLVAYLPTIYSAWQRREHQVALLETRAGSPPSAWEWIIRFRRIRGLGAFAEVWPEWESWFVDVEESHTSLSSVNFFRSPQPDRSWVTAAGVVLDTAALMSAAVDVPRDPQRELTIRTGYLALRRIAQFFRIPFDADPRPDDPISISRQEFDEVYDQLAIQDVPMKADREQAWKDYAGWRVNYDSVLLALAALTMAAYAPWVSDRSRWRMRGFSLTRPILEPVAPTER